MSHDDLQLRADDAAARLRALELESFIVEAPAGAGKTELLTQRFLKLLTTVEHPESIIAITFTNKAAAEMRERILGNLQAVAAGQTAAKPHQVLTYTLAAEVLERDRALGWTLLEQAGRLRILTIDALCGALARQMPFLTRFGAQPGVTEDSSRLYAEAARRTLALLEATDQATSVVVGHALQHLDNDASKLETLIATMLGQREQWRGHIAGGVLVADVEAVGEALRILVEAELQSTLATVGSALQTELMPLARYAANNLGAGSPIAPLLDWTEALTVSADDLPRWQALAAFLQTGGAWRKPRGITVKQGFPAEKDAGKDGAALKQRMGEVLDRLVTQNTDPAPLTRVTVLPDPRLGDDEATLVRVFAALLEVAVDQLQGVFRAEGQVDFIEVALRAQDALRDASGPTDLALRLDYAIRHLLVDEFQDTSPAQIRLLEALTEGWSAGDGRTLFCVGDPMQSIYRFRKAEVGLFLGAARHGIGTIRLTPLRLSLNNRSAPEVIGWVNRELSRIFPAQDSELHGDIRYRPFVANHAPISGAAVAAHPVLVVDAPTSAEADRREAHTIINLIDAAREQDADGSIAVLVRGRGHLETLVAEMRRTRAQLRFQAVEVEALAERQWVADVVILTRALLQRADRVNWIALLRAPWCGLTLADLHALLAAEASDADRERTVWSMMNDPARLARVSDDGRKRLDQLRTVLAAAYAHQGRQTLTRWLYGVWLQIDGPATLPDAAAAQDIDAYFARLEQLEGAGSFALDRLDEELKALYSAPDPQADGRLVFMTIHKSKGLEFDTVIMPGLHRSGGRDDDVMLLWDQVEVDDGPPRLIVAPYVSKRMNAGQPTAYSLLRDIEQGRAKNEELRVLYVAATRAVRALHWVGVCAPDKDGQLKPRSGTFLETLWPLVGAVFNAAAEAAPVMSLESAATLPNEASFIPKLLRLPTCTPVLMEGLGAAASVEFRELASSTGFAEDGGQEVGAGIDAAIGTVTHRVLERIVREGVEQWNEARVHHITPALNRQLAALGVPAEAFATASARVASMLVTTLQSQDGQWVLSVHDQGGAEMALATVDDGAVHIIDRTFVADGVRWIVDYKTTRLGRDGATPTPAELQTAAATYRDQLDRYAALFVSEGLPVRRAVFFTERGVLVLL